MQPGSALEDLNKSIEDIFALQNELQEPLKKALRFTSSAVASRKIMIRLEKSMKKFRRMSINLGIK